MKAKLDDVIEALELRSDEGHYFYAVDTEEVVYVTIDDLRMAEDGEITDDLPEWQKDMVETAADIIENWDNHIKLPTQFDINEYNIMSEFCYSLESKTIRNQLLNAIKGSGAFRRFKTSIQHIGIEKQWYSFKDKYLYDMAVSARLKIVQEKLRKFPIRIKMNIRDGGT